ncbi:MAG: J domain-containing protein [Candidatus Beckwithbacteria bacterium]|nr:J domain-containing protein [Candidatus Beckwithbacteria bacterium]
MSKQEESRRLEFSDIASELHAEILKNPYLFLGLPDNVGFTEVRRVYLAKVRLYHPDMVNPGSDIKTLARRYSQEEIETVLHCQPDSHSEEPTENLEAAILQIEQTTEADLKERGRILEAIRGTAHEKMVQLNTAFEAIKVRIGQRQWKTFAGYDSRTVVEDEGFSYQQVFLEGAAELNIFQQKLGAYWIPGAYLSFDWGLPIDHEYQTWSESDYRYDIAVKHLSVYQEIQEGREQITPVLLQPFFKMFKLKPAQQQQFTSLLLEQRFSSGYIRELLGFPDFKDVKQDSDAWFRSRDFEWQVNEMQTLSWFHDSWNPRISMRQENGKLILKDFTETILSETDVMLLSTLAYGPMLSNG